MGTGTSGRTLDHVAGNYLGASQSYVRSVFQRVVVAIDYLICLHEAYGDYICIKRNPNPYAKTVAFCFARLEGVSPTTRIR